MTAIRARLLLLALALGCGRGAPPEPAPLPEPVSPAPPSLPLPPPVAGTPYVAHQLAICVVRNGRLEDVQLEYDTHRGDTTYLGRPLSAAFPTDSTYGLAAPWYRDSEPIAFARGRYVKYGLPRLLGSTELVPVGAFRGVTVFAEPESDRDRPEVIYVPVRPGCEFQPYVPMAKM